MPIIDLFRSKAFIVLIIITASSILGSLAYVKAFANPVVTETQIVTQIQAINHTINRTTSIISVTTSVTPQLVTVPSLQILTELTTVANRTIIITQSGSAFTVNITATVHNSSTITTNKTISLTAYTYTTSTLNTTTTSLVIDYTTLPQYVTIIIHNSTTITAIQLTTQTLTDHITTTNTELTLTTITLENTTLTTQTVIAVTTQTIPTTTTVTRYTTSTCILVNGTCT